MRLGRLEITISAYTVIAGILGFLWLGLSAGWFQSFWRALEIREWRQACERDQGVFEIDEYGMSCTFPNGARKSMRFRTPEL